MSLIPKARLDDIAVVGMSLVCPGASTVGRFWNNLISGTDSITEVPDNVIESFYFDGFESGRPDRFYCKRGGFISPGVVDPMRYGILPVAADGSDPDQLLSYFLAEDALSDAGVFERGISLDRASVIIGRGNFAGLPQLRGVEIIRMVDEWLSILKHALPDLTDAELDRVRSQYQSSFGRWQGDTAAATMPNLVASGVANHFDMHGPAYCIDAACASGIVALQHSANLLRSGEVDIAIAGGMHTLQSSVFWGAFTMMGALSHRGEIAPFSKEADGLLIGQGAGFMVLKTVAKAEDDGDRIYAVVRSAAIGSDGGGHSVLITDSNGQAAVIERAWSESGLDKQDIAYLEAHGTGTPVGDATELETLTRVFGGTDQPQARLGSVKSNIGHLMPAAGMMGLIKTALSLYHRQIPPTLHCAEPLEAMSKSRFAPATTLVDWEGSNRPLVAGVDAFGFGGINSHAVLTAYEEPGSEAARYRADRLKQVSPEAYAVAGSSREAVRAKLDVAHFKSQFGSIQGNPEDRFRLVIFNPTLERQKQAMEIVDRGEPWLGPNDIWYTEDPLIADGGQVAFMFPGWDASAGVDIRSLIDELGLPVKKYPGEDHVLSDDPVVGHFRTSMMVHDALEATGLRADFFGGHSIGEWHAARSAGMLDDNFDQVIYDLAQLAANEINLDLPSFRLVVANGSLDEEQVKEILDESPDVYLTNDNCPSQKVFCAVGGSEDALIRALEAKRVRCQVLSFGTALHTPLFQYVINTPLEAMSHIPVLEGKAPLVSAISLDEVSTGPEVTSDVLGAGMSQPVYFRQLVDGLYERGVRIFIQSGIGPLPGFIEDTLRGRRFATMSAISPLRNAVDQLRRVHALMFVMGGPADLTFMGMRPTVQRFKTLYLMPTGSPILRELPSLDAVLSSYARRNNNEPASGCDVVASPGKSGRGGHAMIDPSSQNSNDGLVEAAVNIGASSEARSAFRKTVPVATNAYGLPVRGFTRSWSRSTVSAWPAFSPSPRQAVADFYGANGLSQVMRVVPSAMEEPIGGTAPMNPAVQEIEKVSINSPERIPNASVSSGSLPHRAGSTFVVPLDISLDEHPYVLDHSIVNQPKDWPHREDFYSVVPLTMSMELMAEIALGQAPGLKVVKLGPITAMEFIPLTIPFHAEVKGFWKSEHVVSLTIPGHLMIDVTLADESPEEPSGIVEQYKSAVGRKIREPLTCEYQYVEYSFHRSNYWSVTEYDFYGEHGFHYLLHRRAGKGSLLDAMGQTIGVFLHLYMPDNRVSFPVRVKEVKFYQDMFDQDGEFEAYTVIRQVTDKFITGDTVYLRNGKIWALATGWVNQRLDMDMSLWEAVNHPWRSILATKLAKGVYYFNPGNPPRSSAYFLVLCYLSATEKERVDAMPNWDAQTDFLAGRVALKDAVRDWLHSGSGDYKYPMEISVRYDDLGKPWVCGDDGGLFVREPAVSVAHTHGHGVAMVGRGPVGVDIELIEDKSDEFWDLALTTSERQLIKKLGDETEWGIRFWTAKEAYSKSIGQGLQGRPRRFVVEAVDGESLRINDVWIDTVRIDEEYIVGWCREGNDE
ncbi:MAG: 4'-phosphopantetheinyl transferase superfamily protein [Propionibacteriaceae bacterium]|jgi:acyl transferase domain-containing protein/phosphopantetheinyl transferase|nr:4'-phosphopantetheinyl transferase superfamily protein [Propionibacteriaceae bacterium]